MRCAFRGVMSWIMDLNVCMKIGQFFGSLSNGSMFAFGSVDIRISAVPISAPDVKSGNGSMIQLSLGPVLLEVKVGFLC